MSADTGATANDRQVGGCHYAVKKSAPQHWDIITNHGIDYLRGCATKYVSRARQKGGRQDLEKALHYLEKRVEVLSGKIPCGHNTFTVPLMTIIDWAEGASLTIQEMKICTQILSLNNEREAIAGVSDMIRSLYPDPKPEPEDRAGTPEDGGHHARASEHHAPERGVWAPSLLGTLMAGAGGAPSLLGTLIAGAGGHRDGGPPPTEEGRGGGGR